MIQTYVVKYLILLQITSSDSKGHKCQIYEIQEF